MDIKILYDLKCGHKCEISKTIKCCICEDTRPEPITESLTPYKAYKTETEIIDVTRCHFYCLNCKKEYSRKTDYKCITPPNSPLKRSKAIIPDLFDEVKISRMQLEQKDKLILDLRRQLRGLQAN